MSIAYFPEQKLFKLSTAHTDYDFRVTPAGRLNHLYCGASVQTSELAGRSLTGLFTPQVSAPCILPTLRAAHLGI